MFNKKELLNHFDNDFELIKLIYEEFKKSTHVHMQDLRESIDKLDFDGIEGHAHTIKGAASNFFAEEVVEISFSLEQKGKENIDQSLQEDIQKLDSLLSNLEIELDTFIKSGDTA